MQRLILTLIVSLACGLANARGADNHFSPHNEIAEWEGLNYDIIEEALDNYYKCFDEFPAGNNREVIRQLCGLNPMESVKRIESRSHCYQLALGIKILAQLKERALSLDQIKKLLFSWDAGDPIILTFPEGNLIDPWGTPYVIELSDQRVVVHSKHTSCVAVESLLKSE